MADAYWRYAAAAPRQQQQQQQPPPSAGGGVAHPGMGGGAPQMAPAGGQQQPMKRPRPTEFSDVPGAPDTAGYYPRDEERAGYRAARDTESLNASYERFLRTGQIQSFGGGHAGEPIRPAVGGNAAYPVDDRSMMAAREGVPSDCTRREVSHIFRPFVGFREVRLVNKEPKHVSELLVFFVAFFSFFIVICSSDYFAIGSLVVTLLSFVLLILRNLHNLLLHWMLCKAISLTSMIAIHPICGCSLLVSQVQRGIQDLVVVVGDKLLAFLFASSVVNTHVDLILHHRNRIGSFGLVHPALRPLFR
uniref:Uncharacterized protein n=1 Tax=Zea mays TaxID=4577 RepID=A0A804R196_MAIZE